MTALKREIAEEVGLNIESADFLTDITHAYPGKEVTLLVFRVTRYTGDPVCKESQTGMRWVAYSQLRDFDFPEANEKIMNLLIVPEQSLT
jgi:8-oxo-dGTP diphosphatase